MGPNWYACLSEWRDDDCCAGLIGKFFGWGAGLGFGILLNRVRYLRLSLFWTFPRACYLFDELIPADQHNVYPP